MIYRKLRSGGISGNSLEDISCQRGTGSRLFGEHISFTHCRSTMSLECLQERCLLCLECLSVGGIPLTERYAIELLEIPTQAIGWQHLSATQTAGHCGIRQMRQLFER